MSGVPPVEISVVIPVYRSAATLPALVPRLLAVLDLVAESYEIVLVDDCSPDNSWEVVQDLQRRYPDCISAVQLMRNFGQHNALMSGFHHAAGQIIVTMDDDLQHPPEEIPKLLQALKSSELDLVYGAYEEKRHALGRNLGSNLVRWFYHRIFGNKVRVSSFRAMRRRLVENVLPYNLNFTYLDGLLAWHTRRIGEALVRHEPRQEGRSGYSLGKLLELALNLFTNFSMGPLRAVSLLGFLSALLGFATGGYYFVRYLASDITVPGFASIIIAIMVLGGAQMLALGVMGEYLGRLHLNINRKPQYSERNVVGRAGAAGAERRDIHTLEPNELRPFSKAG